MTLMHISSRAPELSAACKRVLSWIMAPILRSFRRRALDHAHQGPGFVPRKRAALRDRDGVALAALVLFVVRQQLRRSAHVLSVSRVLDQPLDRNGDGLVHPVADDGAGQRLARLVGGVDGRRRLRHGGLLRRGLLLHRLLLGCLLHALLPACARSISFRIVFTRAILPMAFACWSGRAGCPEAAAMRRLNCSRRSSFSSSRSSSRLLPRRPFTTCARSLTFFLLISAPAAARTRSRPKAWPRPA